MSNRSILYGDIVDAEMRQEIENTYVSGVECLLWRTQPELFEPQDDPSLIFVDLDNPDFSNSDFLLSIATSGEKVKIVGKSEQPTTAKALRVAKLGVSEILTPEQCIQRLHDFLTSLESETIVAATEKKTGPDVDSLVGCSGHINEIRAMIKLLADVDFPSALILGETGTGKSFVAKILHNIGTRAAHNMVEVNCSAIPDDLFESELFGHTKGAFTDAKAEKIGLFEYAQNGTLFLDEVGNLSASAQAKLLKILEDKKLRRVGDINERDINVRVVAATNIDLRDAIEAGRFREDLYFRLNLLTIDIPPLRNRREDIPDMVRHFLAFYSSIYSKPRLIIADAAIELMQEHSWPGNVRELSNVIEKAALLNRGNIIRQSDIAAALKRSRVSAADRRRIAVDLPPQGKSLDEIESGVVLQVLDMFDWNKSRTAEYLKISRPRLRRIIDNHGLEQNRRQG